MGLERAGSTITSPSRGPTTIGIGRIGPPSRGPSSFKISSPEFRSSFSKTKSPTLSNKINNLPAKPAGFSLFEKTLSLAKSKNQAKSFEGNSKNLLPERTVKERPLGRKISDVFGVPIGPINVDRPGLNNSSVEKSVISKFTRPLIKFDTKAQTYNIEQQERGPVAPAKIKETVTPRERARNLVTGFQSKNSLVEVFKQALEVKKFEFPKLEIAPNIITQNKASELIEKPKVQDIVKRSETFKIETKQPEIAGDISQRIKTIEAFKTAQLPVPEILIKQPQKVTETMTTSVLLEAFRAVSGDIEIQKAIRVLSNPAKVNPETTTEFRNIAKTEILNLVQKRQKSSEDIGQIQFIESIKARFFVLIKREARLRLEKEPVEEEELVAEVDDEAMEERFRSGDKALQEVIDTNPDKDTVTLREVKSKISMSNRSLDRQTSEPLKFDSDIQITKIRDGSLKETLEDLAADTEELSVSQAFYRIRDYITRKPAIRFRKVVTTREAKREDIDRVFQKGGDINSILNLAA